MKTQSVVSALSLVLALGILGCSTGEDIGRDQNALKQANAPVYLALGDSIPFGENPPIEPANNPSLYVGYPKFLAEMIDKPLVNAACPGETTGSMLSPYAADNGCDAFKAAESLHVDYDGTQIAYAVQYLSTHGNVKLVTLQLGANDLLKALHECNDDLFCVLPQVEAILGGVVGNLIGTLMAIRSTGYAGQIILPLYYSTVYTFDQTNPGYYMMGAINALNDAIRYVAADPYQIGYNVQTADVFTAFLYASYPAGGDPCAAGLLIPLAEGGCDKHPSAAGAQLIAQVVAGAVAP
jgi:lysophospholipase L1-like esterase